MSKPEGQFFIGWAVPEGALRAFVLGVGAGLVVLFGAAAYLFAATQDDPGDGAFKGAAMATGILQVTPYPVVHVTDSARIPVGSALILSGNGKRGVADRAAALDGQLVTVSGQRLERGDLYGMQLRGGARGLSAAEGTSPPPELTDLGPWRITGEICDGKCLVGAMRPGRGLAHKACANLCITGGVPPVFVATDRIEGHEFFLMADAEGGPLPDDVLIHTATLVSIEGRLERRGNLMVFRIDTDSIELAQ